MSDGDATSREGAVAFFGSFGAWTHIAARRFFGLAADFRESTTIARVFSTVSEGGARYGVVPIENSTEGGVNQTVDQLVESELSICGEVVLDIEQCLLGKATDLSHIERVYSHPQGLAQCRRWLAEHLPHAEQVASLSTTAGAREAALDSRFAAISSPLAAELNGLCVIQAAIQDESGNATRFVVVARDDVPATGHDKTSLVFATPHTRGALRRALEVFDHAGLNLTRIESRPAPGKRWEYVFLADLEGHRNDAPVAGALRELAAHCARVKVLGSYARAS